MNFQESERSECTRWRSLRRSDGKPAFWRPFIAENCERIFVKMTTPDIRILLSCVVTLAIDPLFYFIPLIDSDKFCFTFDKALAVVVCVLRTFFDSFYLFHINFNSISKFNPPSPDDSSREYRKAIWKTVRSVFYLIIDILSILPIPQVLVLVLMQHSDSVVSDKIIKWTIICQYVPRFLRTYPISMNVLSLSGNVAESKSIRATINFLFYMLFSYKSKTHVGVRRVKDNQMFCSSEFNNNAVYLNTTCPLIDPTEIPRNSTDFNFGMYTDALRSGVLEKKNNRFMRTFIYCCRWGLRHISALGQNLETSNFTEENIFAIVIGVSGLLLFAILIGNVQKYLQSSTTRVDEKEDNKRDTDTWMSKRELPKYLKDEIRKHGDYKWRETRGIDEKTLLQSLPKHLVKDIRHHLYGKLIARLKLVPQFQKMDYPSLEALYSRLKTAYYTKNSYFVKEGEPVEDMLYIRSGKLEGSTTTYGSETGEEILCGEELFEWAFDPQSSHYPISSITIQAKTEVEGFLLSACDLKFVASQNGPQNQQDMSP